MPLRIFVFYLLSTCLAFGQVALPADSLLRAANDHPQKDSIRVYVLNQLAYSNHRNNPVKSLQYCYEALTIADSLSLTKSKTEALHQIGLAFWTQAQATSAMNYFLTALRLAESNHYAQLEADLIGNIGTCYSALGNPGEALLYLNKSRVMQEKLQSYPQLVTVVNSIGDTYRVEGELENAEKAYRDALAISRERNYELGINFNLRNLGNVLELRQKYDSALVNYFKSLEMSTQMNDMRAIVLTQMSIATTYLKTKKFALAKQHATKGLQVVGVTSRALIRDLYRVLGEISEAEGDEKKALQYFKTHLLYKDSVQSFRVASDIAAERMRFGMEQKQSEIEILQKEDELKAAEISFQKSQLILISISLIVTLALLAFGVISYRKMGVKNKLLIESQVEISQKNVQLTEQSDELSTLNEELQAQQDELMLTNEKIELMNAEVRKVNQDLEKLVEARTEVLIRQNRQLTEYSYFNAHKLRSPLATIMGLVDLLQRSTLPSEETALIKHLDVSSKQLDSVVRSINDTLQNGIQEYQNEEKG